MVPRFEQAVAIEAGAKHAFAVNSATSALHIACLAVGLGPGDVLWTVPNSFVASANCALYCGARVDFVDIDPTTWNMSVDQLRAKLEHARAANAPLPKVVVPVHFAGQPTYQKAIRLLADEFGFLVIEDASHSIGASVGNEPVGSCRWSDMTVFSFHPVKIITTAEGGMVLTNNDDLARRLAVLRTHGITRDPEQFVGEPDPAAESRGSWYYEQVDLGFNYRMTDLQAALGISQLARLPGFVETRNQLATRYHKKLEDLPLQLPYVSPGNRSAYHLYVVRLTENVAIGRRALFDAMRAEGIGVNVHYTPIHLQPYYRRLGFSPGSCPEAERHGTIALTLPLHAGLTHEEQDHVITVLRRNVG
jgi:UDP-4-amino-4,6-dideoxy-N-acetyl-beta-L-altrosamine transaminase